MAAITNILELYWLRRLFLAATSIARYGAKVALDMRFSAKYRCPLIDATHASMGEEGLHVYYCGRTKPH